MIRKFANKSLSRFPHEKLAGVFVLIALFVFLIRGGLTGPTPTSDYIFFGELVALFVITLILVFFNKFLPRRMLFLPWLGALLAATSLIVYVANSQTFGQLVVSPYELLTYFIAYAEGTLNFFGFFQWAEGGLSAIPPMIDMHIAMLVGFIGGLYLEKFISQKQMKLQKSQYHKSARS